MKDYYYILGLDKNASIDQIKKAYRKLSLKFHPDQNNGDKFFEERFREINEAYETLGNDFKREIYNEELRQKTSAETNRTKPKEEPKSAYTPPPKSRTEIKPKSYKRF